MNFLPEDNDAAHKIFIKVQLGNPCIPSTSSLYYYECAVLSLGGEIGLCFALFEIELLFIFK